MKTGTRTQVPVPITIDDLLVLVNAVIAQMKADGTLRQLHEKFGLVYGYE